MHKLANLHLKTWYSLAKIKKRLPATGKLFQFFSFLKLRNGSFFNNFIGGSTTKFYGVFFFAGGGIPPSPPPVTTLLYRPLKANKIKFNRPFVDLWILGETSLSMVLGCPFQLMIAGGTCHLYIVEEVYKISND